MASFVDELRPQLKQGYTLVSQAGRTWRLFDPDGSLVRNDQGQPLLVSETGSWHLRRRVMQQLREVHALRPAVAHTHRPKLRAVKSEVKGTDAPPNPVVVAKEILKDPKSSGRERAIAKAYLRLLEDHNRVMAAAEYIRQRLRSASEEGED